MKSYVIFAQRVGLIGVTNILASISSFILLAVLTKNLPIDQYGIWVEVNVTVSVVTGVATLGMPFTMTRFLAAAHERAEIQEGFYTLAAIVVGALLVVAALFFIFAEPVAAVLFSGDVAVARIVPVVLFLSTFNSFLLNFFRTFQQVKRYALVAVSMVYANVAFVTLFLLLGYGLYGALTGLITSQVLVLLATGAIIVASIGVKRPRFIRAREYLSFGLPTIPANLANWAVDSSDRYLIGILLGTAMVGYYSPAYTLGTGVYVLFAPLTLLLPPALAKGYDAHNRAEVERTLEYTLRYCLLLAIPAFFGVSVLAPLLLSLLSTQAIAAQSASIVPFVALGYLILGVYGVVSNVLVLEKRTSVIGTVWIIVALVNIVLNVIFLPSFGIIVAAVTTLTSFALALALILYSSGASVTLRFDWRFLIKVLVASTVMSALVISLNPYNLPSLVVVVIVAIGVYAGLLILLKGLRTEELRFLRSLLRLGA